jgi:hypothetical protein
VLIELASHNDDIRRLLEKGYALRVDGTYLVVRDIPYLDDQGVNQVGRSLPVLNTSTRFGLSRTIIKSISLVQRRMAWTGDQYRTSEAGK